MTCSLYFVELTVRDFERSIAWYRDVLGLEVLLRDDARRWAMFVAGSGRVAIKEGEPGTGGPLLAFEVDDLESWVGRLRAQGVAIDGEVTLSPEGFRSARLRDPDEYAIRLFEWC